MSHTRMTTLPFLLLALSPSVIFDSDNPLISCPLCKSKTLWNIFMILGRNVEQDQTTHCVQEWQLCLSYFWSYLHLLCLTVIIHWFRVRSVSQRPFGIYLWYLVEMKTGPGSLSGTRMTTLPFLPLALSPFVIFDRDYPLILCPLCKSKTLWNIFFILGRNVEQDQIIQEWQLCLSYFGRNVE